MNKYRIYYKNPGILTLRRCFLDIDASYATIALMEFSKQKPNAIVKKIIKL